MFIARRIALLLTFAIFAVALTTTIGYGASVSSGHRPGPNPAGHDRGKSNVDPAAHHSLREPVTDQNFYFVMADRFDNGDPANDNGGLPPGKGEGQSGFDPTGKGWYHGGDLKGLTQKLDYIQGLGTTAIWLTPSFKNKAVQDNNGFPSAGYHGYWITDFTQIDPHFGTNERPARARRRARTRAGSRSTSTSSPTTPRTSSSYEEGAVGRPYTSKDRVPVPDGRRRRRSTTATTPARAGLPAAAPDRASRRARPARR